MALDGLSRALFRLADGGVGLQPTWQEIIALGCLLALFFMAARCGESGSQRGGDYRLGQSLALLFMAARVPRDRRGRGAHFPALLDFVLQGHLSRHS